MICGNGERVAAPDDQREVLQDDRQADRGDQRREARRAPQRPVGDALERVADAPCRRGSRRARPRRTITSGGRPVCAPASALITVKRDHRADHHDLAVREVDELDDAVDHRVAQRDDRVDAAERQAVDELLEEDVQKLP